MTAFESRRLIGPAQDETGRWHDYVQHRVVDGELVPRWPASGVEVALDALRRRVALMRRRSPIMLDGTGDPARAWPWDVPALAFGFPARRRISRWHGLVTFAAAARREVSR